MDIFEYFSQNPEFGEGFKIGLIIFGSIAILKFLLRIKCKPLKGSGGFLTLIILGIIFAFGGDGKE